MGFTQVLRARGEAGLVVLLRLRPDLAAPPPSSVRALEARATSRASVERALAAVDAQVLQALEAVLALAPAAGRGPLTVGAVTTATGGPPDDVVRAVGTALDLALLWADDVDAGAADGAWPDDTASAAAWPALPDVTLHAAPGLDDVLGPYPAGLGPTLSRTLGRREAASLATLEEATRGDGPPTTPDPAALAVRLADPAVVERLLTEAPPGARQVLDALRWGPPVGRTPEKGTGPTPARAAVEWLLRHGLATSDTQHVVLPREVSLALRGGRTHADPAVAPAADGVPVPAATVAAESAVHASEAVRRVGVVLATWSAEPPPVLRSGGLGVRELRRLAGRLEVDERVAALLVEVAGSAGLVTADGEEQPSVVPTTDADDWLGQEPTARWAALARDWLASERAAWLVGTRDERGAVRAALDPELRRPWVPRLRRQVLDVLAATSGAPSAADVHALLGWRAPRAAPPLHAVEAVLEEAAVLGVTGAGGLAPAGRALLDPAGDAASALAGQLAPAVDEVLLQGDLTGIVPGRPGTALAALLEDAAVVESRGAAVTVRFTDASVQRALDAGRTAEGLLAELSRHARAGVPQPLEYLVLDAARRHGRVRAGAASAYLRSDDPTLLAGLAEDRALRGLGLLVLAPTVLASQAPPSTLLAVLRERGVPVVAEDASGRVLTLEQDRHRVRAPRRRGVAVTSVEAEGARDRRLHRVAADVLAAARREADDAAAGLGEGPDGTADVGAGADRTAGAAAAGTAPAGSAPSGTAPSGAAPSGAAASGAAPSGTGDPVLALALLREAVAAGSEVWLELVDPSGTPVRRRVRPVRVDGGRVRAVDTVREAELTVAVHRITDVTPVRGEP